MKLVLLGEGRVGKTSIVNRWVNNVFDPDQPSTTDAQMYVKKKLFVDGKSVEIALWDTAGQERYHALGPLYYRNADGALLVYDCTDEDTFDRVRRWIKELQKAANPNIQIVICGNKADREKERQVPEAKADNFARKYSAEHFSTSAKTNLGVDEAFLHLIRSVVAVKEGRLSGNGIDDNDDLFGNMTMGDEDNNGSASTKKKSSKKKSGGRMKIVEDDSNNNDSYDVGDQSGYGSGPAVSASGTQIGGSRVNHLGGRSTAETDDWMPKDEASSANYNRKKNNHDDDDDNGGYSSFTRGGGRYGDDDEEDHHNKASNNNKKKSSTSTKRKQQQEESDEDDNNNGETDYSIDDGSNWNPGSCSKSKPPQKSTPASQVLQQQQQQQQKPKTINLADAPKKTAGGGQQQEKKGCSC